MIEFCEIPARNCSAKCSVNCVSRPAEAATVLLCFRNGKQLTTDGAVSRLPGAFAFRVEQPRFSRLRRLKRLVAAAERKFPANSAPPMGGKSGYLNRKPSTFDAGRNPRGRGGCRSRFLSAAIRIPRISLNSFFPHVRGNYAKVTAARIDAYEAGNYERELREPRRLIADWQGAMP